MAGEKLNAIDRLLAEARDRPFSFLFTLIAITGFVCSVIFTLDIRDKAPFVYGLRALELKTLVTYGVTVAAFVILGLIRWILDPAESQPPSDAPESPSGDKRWGLTYIRRTFKGMDYQKLILESS